MQIIDKILRGKRLTRNFLHELAAVNEHRVHGFWLSHPFKQLTRGNLFHQIGHVPLRLMEKLSSVRFPKE